MTVLTRTDATDPAALEQLASFWQGLGSGVDVMDPEEHDQALALTSHLPHLLASALAGLLSPELYDLTGTGFRDTTRIASGDSSIWTGIFLQNRQAVLAALDLFVAQLEEYRQALRSGDFTALDQLWVQAKKVRDALGS
jgi:prephenate dehydrogenase